MPVPRFLAAAAALAEHAEAADAAIDAVPGLTAAIARDRADGAFAAWGRSTVRDENTGEPVLPAGLVTALHARAGLETDGERGNAGLLHVYGYLFSTVPTPYGAKHERWTGGAVAAALGLPADALVPWGAGQRTPLSALTELAAGRLAAPPPAAVVIDETGEGLAARTVIDAGLLVYGVGAGLDALRLVTVFPVGPGAIEAATSGAPRLRYNALDAAGRARVPLRHPRRRPARR